MRFLVLAAIMCFSAVGLFSQPKDSPAKNEKPATQSTPTPAPSNNDHKPADQTETAKTGPPHWYTSSEWWLVLIAALTGAAIAYQAREMARTTSVMEGQLKEMQGAGTQVREQLELARKNVDYIATTERAWVMGELSWWEKKGPNIDESPVRGAEHTTVHLKLTCKNQGKSPAWIDHVYSRLEIVSGGSLIDDFEELDMESFGDNGRMGPLGVGEERSHGVQFGCYAIRKDKEFLSVYVIVEYRDIFQIKRRTFLGYSIVPPEWYMYRQDGLPNRNRNT